ncbi:hypothetical protein QJS10_CPA16g01681 [Acorus calamus]|nr:hypothetical protein QJS10_CPA16g01681 [Acorus calamus]
MDFEGRIAIKTEPVDSVMEEPVVEPQSLPERLDLGNLDSVPEANAAPENEKIGVVEVGSSSKGNVEGEFDIEKLTVGEWIDRMEKYLPRKINEIADEVILSMRQRAQQYNEFVAEQRRLGNMKLG